jgi:hypothetical protein
VKKGAGAAGYSGTPLAKKLGIVERSRVLPVDPPEEYEELLAPIPRDVAFERRASASTDIAHLFVTRKEELAKELLRLRKVLRGDAAVWVSCPKKASGVATTVTEDVIREVALPLGYVDVKVCAVTEVWSGLKLVVRKELR